jgi:hypothetical protein
LFQLIVGDPLAEPGDEGSAQSFSDINWKAQPLYLRTKVYWNSTWLEMGSAQLFSVPYALVSQSVSGLNSLSVKGVTPIMDSALFEVKNNLGKTVFAVYNEGVRISVADGAKSATKGGFAIGGFDSKAGGEVQEYLKVYPDSTRVYVKDAGKSATKGGFAIGGFGAKTSTGNFLDITKNNYFIGHETGTKITTGGLYNSVIGYQAARNLSTGQYNTVLGYLADSSLTGGSRNIIIGDHAGYSLTTGTANTIMGYQAGYSHTTQLYNVMIGNAAGFHLNWAGWSGSFNTFMGTSAGWAIRNSRDNTFIGTNAGMFLDNGTGNTFVGTDAGRSGVDPSPPGSWVPRAFISDHNTFIGDESGYNITSGYNNLAIGYHSGYSTSTGYGNVFIGSNAGASETGNNKLYIANSSSNPLIYGDFSSKKVGINTVTLNKTLNVGGDAEISGNISAASVSATTLTGGVTGNLTGKVNGMSIGSIFLTEDGTILSTAGGAMELFWDLTHDRIILYNSFNDVIGFWWKTQRGTTAEGSSGIISKGENLDIIPSHVNIDAEGFEIHFGQLNGTGGWCSVWLQYFDGKMVGHYIKY